MSDDCACGCAKRKHRTTIRSGLVGTGSCKSCHCDEYYAGPTEPVPPAAGMVLDGIDPLCRCQHRRGRHAAEADVLPCRDCDCRLFMSADEYAEALLGVAEKLGREMRLHAPRARWRVAGMGRADLEALCCVLAAVYDPEAPVVAWWQQGLIAERRRALNEALSPRRREDAA